MSRAWFDFSEELQFFLPRPQRGQRIPLDFRGRQSLKHLIESLGVPHTEVGRITVDGQEVSLDRLARDGEQVAVYAAGRGLSVAPRFLLDNHLGRLTAYLRMLGFDCLYRNDYRDEQLAEILQHEARLLLTRDRRLLMRKVVRYGYCLRSLEPREQVLEVVRRFDLAGRITPFRRCLRCNHLLEAVSKEAILHRLQPLTRQYFGEFHICPACGQIYWKGSHYDRMVELVRRIAEAG